MFNGKKLHMRYSGMFRLATEQYKGTRYSSTEKLRIGSKLQYGLFACDSSLCSTVLADRRVFVSHKSSLPGYQVKSSTDPC